MSRPMRRLAGAILVALALLSAAGIASVASEPATTNVFYGSTTTGEGQTFPVEINPADRKQRPDGAIGLRFTSKAIGQAEGDLPGAFSYEERGYIYFRDPADPATFAGGELVSAVFTLVPDPNGPPIIIRNSDPANYQFGTATVR